MAGIKRTVASNILVDMGQCIQWCAGYHLGIFYLVHLILFPLELSDAVQQQYLAAKFPKSDTILSLIARTTLTRWVGGTNQIPLVFNLPSTWCCIMLHVNTTYMHNYIYTILNYAVCMRITPHLWENTPATLSDALRIPFTPSVSKGHHRQTEYCRLHAIPWGRIGEGMGVYIYMCVCVFLYILVCIIMYYIYLVYSLLPSGPYNVLHPQPEAWVVVFCSLKAFVQANEFLADVYNLHVNFDSLLAWPNCMMYEWDLLSDHGSRNLT